MEKIIEEKDKRKGKELVCFYLYKTLQKNGCVSSGKLIVQQHPYPARYFLNHSICFCEVISNILIL